MKSLFGFAMIAVFGLATLVAAAGMEEEVQKQIKNLKSEEAGVRKDAADAIGKIGQIKASAAKPALQPLLETLADEEPRVRAAAVTALSRIDEPKDVVPAFLRILKEDSDNSVKMTAATGLGLIGEPAREAVPVLREIAKQVKDSKVDEEKRLGRAVNEAIRQIMGTNKKK